MPARPPAAVRNRRRPVCRGFTLSLPLSLIWSALFAQSHSFQARQHLGTEERQLLDVIRNGHRYAGQARGTKLCQITRHTVGIADDRQAAEPMRGVLPQTFEF